jgi:hypothetical protein
MWPLNTGDCLIEVTAWDCVIVESGTKHHNPNPELFLVIY